MQQRIKMTLNMVIIALLVFTASGCTGSDNSQKIAVTSAPASNQELETRLELSGVLVPAQTVEISSKFTGQAIKLGFKVGSAVKAGDVLMILDTEALNGQLMQAEASLQSAQAAEQSSINQASLAKINLDTAQRNFDRIKILFDSGAVSQSQLDEAQDKLNTAHKQYETAAGSALDQARAAVNVALASVKNFQIQISNATIKSPLDGIISNQSINVGQIASQGVAVISIVDTSTLKMKSTVSQDILPLLSIGQEMALSIDSYPDTKVTGTITGIGPIAVNTGEVFPVEISINNDNHLMAGLSAHASEVIKTSGLVIPSAALVQKNGEDYVYVITNNTAYQRTVKIGLKNSQGVQVVEGLQDGEQVAVTELGALSDNKPVKTGK